MTQTLSKNVIADFSTQLAVKMAVGATTGTLASATDSDSVALPTGTYFLTIDKNNSKKEYIKCTLTGTALTSIQSISRQGALTSGTAREHRVGANVIISDFASLSKMNDVLTGVTSFDSATPLGYDGTASITTDNQFATKKYVNDEDNAIDTVIATLDAQNVKLTGDQTISSGVKTFVVSPIVPTPTTSTQVVNKSYADGLAIAGSPDSSTTVKGIGQVSVAPVSPTTPIFVGDNDPRVPTQSENDALVGTGTPSSSNKYVTEDTFDAIYNFGDGSDGAVTISSPTTLTRDMYYSSLVVTDTLTTNGYKVFVSGTISGAGTIKWGVANNGANASGSTAGAGGAANASGGQFYLNSAGGAGTNNTPGGSSGGSGTSMTTSVGVVGGNGGGLGGFVGSGGAVTAPTTKFAVFADLTLKGIDFVPATPGFGGIYKTSGGGGGGSGGYNSGAGGGGGASGGIVFLCAKNWTGTFTIMSVGGNGGNASTPGSPTNNNGGGGGGSGGVSIVIYDAKTWTGSYSLAGGTKGTDGAGGTSAQNGTTGISYEILMTSLTR